MVEMFSKSRSEHKKHKFPRFDPTNFLGLRNFQIPQFHSLRLCSLAGYEIRMPLAVVFGQEVEVLVRFRQIDPFSVPRKKTRCPTLTQIHTHVLGLGEHRRAVWKAKGNTGLSRCVSPLASIVLARAEAASICFAHTRAHCLWRSETKE